jgi:phage terminase small subunit
MPTEQQQVPSAYDELTEKQRAFVDAYVQCRNKTKAALMAGYAEVGASVEGHRLLRNAKVWAAKEERMSGFAMGAEEAMQRMSEVASTRLNEYFTIQKVQGYEQERVTLKELVERKEGEIDFVREFINREGIESEEEQIPYLGKIAALREELLNYLLLQEQHGDEATLLVAGKPVVVEQAELDLVAIARAEGEGLVTEFKHTKDGIQVKIADPVPALRDMLRIHGKFEKDNEQSATKITGVGITVRRASEKGGANGA